jgi:hypothetical protein
MDRAPALSVDSTHDWETWGFISIESVEIIWFSVPSAEDTIDFNMGWWDSTFSIEKVDYLWCSVPSEEDTQSADISEKWFVGSPEFWQPGPNRNMFMVLTGQDSIIWERSENTFKGRDSGTSESMFSEPYQWPIQKLTFQQKSKHNSEATIILSWYHYGTLGTAIPKEARDQIEIE